MRINKKCCLKFSNGILKISALKLAFKDSRKSQIMFNRIQVVTWYKFII